MDINIRKHIINNFKDDDKDKLKEALDASVKEQDEELLPGEGVFFEIIWEDSSKELKDKLLNIILNRLQKEK